MDATLDSCAKPPRWMKEKKMSLSLETSKLGEWMILHCKGRIVFRDEAAALSQTVAELLEQTRHFVLDLQGVNAIDSGGLGELVALHMWARAAGCRLRFSGLSSRIHRLLELTNLTSILEIYATEEDAVEACEPEMA